MPKFKFFIRLRKKRKSFTIEKFLKLVKRKKKELGEDGFEAWNAKFWSELDKGTSPYFSAKGDV